jgi:hypothetical protein
MEFDKQNMSKFQVVFFVILCIGFQNMSAQPVPIYNIRDQFFTMDKSKDGALKLYKSLENSDLAKDPVMLAYRGASSAASAGSVGGAWKKLEYFNHGKSELEKAVRMKPLDAEIRFLRLATQANSPGFLGYKGDLKNDMALIIQLLTSVNSNHPNAYLYLRICRFMLLYVELGTSEKNTVNQLIEKFNTKK